MTTQRHIRPDKARQLCYSEAPAAGHGPGGASGEPVVLHQRAAGPGGVREGGGGGWRVQAGPVPCASAVLMRRQHGPASVFIRHLGQQM